MDSTVSEAADQKTAQASPSSFMQSADVIKNQLTVTRNEIYNLRQQMRNLKCTQEKEIENLRSIFQTTPESSGICVPPSNASLLPAPEPTDEDVTLKYIGVISTCFPKRRGTPRQPGICMRSSAKLTLSNSIFTNPEHALEGLEEFSHLWIIFHFHKNDSTHVRAKIAPPRLNGIKTGVFSTRSPHRPSPLGLSLVQIDKIEGASIFFSGVDMLDGTPVVDIKPYIPDYDDPMNLVSNQSDDKCLTVSEDFHQVDTLLSSSDVDLRLVPREAPDGEEAATPIGQSSQPVKSVPTIRVPSWISEPLVSKLSVEFDDRARISLDELKRNSSTANPEEVISKVLQEDPRSTYLRERYANQFYTFEIDHFQVSVKFDDVNHKVLVYRINESSCQNCLEPAWKCTNSCKAPS